MSEAVRKRVVARGRVQNVWFRDTARREAEQLGLAGSARNRDDGAVEMEIEGEPTAVERFIGWAHDGPPRARVDDVEVTDLPPEGATGFRIA